MANGTSTYLFWLGVLIAIIMGLAPFVQGIATYYAWLVLIQVIIGLIIGYLNIQPKETKDFYLGSLSFLISYPVFVSATSTLTVLTGLWGFINNFLAGMAVMIAPAVVLVALKQLPAIMKD
jgi:uncharacterized membrane protein